jgi:hypothetical protein
MGSTLVPSLFPRWGLHRVGRDGEASRTDRDRRAGQRYGMDSPGTWEILRTTSASTASGTGLERDQALREDSARTGANEETKSWSEEANP